MTSNSWTQNEEHDIPSQISKTDLDGIAYFLDIKMYGLLVHLYVGWTWFAPKLQWSVGRTNCLHYSTRLGLVLSSDIIEATPIYI